MSTYIGPLTFTCLTCGTIFTRSRHHRKTIRFCSRKCRRKIIGLIPLKVGDTSYRLTLVCIAGNNLTCLCSCGGEVSVKEHDWRRGHARSCGCAIKNLFQRTHGQTQSSEYRIWAGVLDRCYRSSHKNYQLYGGRGIVVCDRWRTSFVNFLSDMGPRPSPKHSIDRYPNRSGNYEPNNCRWATQLEQMSNTSINHWITINGVTRHLAEWARRAGHPSDGIIRYRLKKGITGEELLREISARKLSRPEQMDLL